uniref:Secreted protein n=1 Tax=Peronospora matthiolae TaxID=2874970 RepID=A0AAV1T766_9STRA
MHRTASTRSFLFSRFGVASARAVASQSDAAEKTLRSPNQLNVLLSNQTPPTTFVATCRALRVIDETALLVTIDVRRGTWHCSDDWRLKTNAWQRSSWV